MSIYVDDCVDFLFAAAAAFGTGCLLGQLLVGLLQ